MAGSQREFKARIKSTQSLKKIFRAMELIAATRISKARTAVDQARPYARAISRAISSVAVHSDIDHPLTSERAEKTGRAAILVITADRGMAGAYSANALRESERLRERLQKDGKEVVQFVLGRRGVSYFKFRNRPVANSWEGDSDRPEVSVAQEVAGTLLEHFLNDEPGQGVDEIHIVYTRFTSMVTQDPFVLRMLPIEVVEGVAVTKDEIEPLYELEPSAEEVLDALLPRYIESRVYSCMLQAAASELAGRQRAMNTAVKNADDVITNYTRLANTARQDEITQEISEIVSGADALAASA